MYSARMFGYRVYNLIYYFLIYSFIGGCIEITYLAIQTGKYVSRGFLLAPICPIYGFGMILILVFLKSIKCNLPLYFISASVLASLLEYASGKALEILFDKRLWDYSYALLNLEGLICLRSSLIWGMLAVVIIYFFHPLVRHLLRLIPAKVGVIVLYMLLLGFSLDVTASVISQSNIEYTLFRK